MSVERRAKHKSISKNVTPQPAKEWETLERYCERTGDSRDAVHARRKKGIWRDGVETCIGPNGRVWVCPHSVYRWVESGAGVML